MKGSLDTLPAIPPEVQEFAAAKEVGRYLRPVIDLARRAFPSSALSVSLGRDAEDETHQYIALDVAVGGLATEELLAGQRTWSAGVARVCPSRQAVYFVLGWR
jgi:alkylhydroperoxidase/carboxymuconolactone decarboxylase family protein YurZ